MDIDELLEALEMDPDEATDTGAILATPADPETVDAVLAALSEPPEPPENFVALGAVAVWLGRNRVHRAKPVLAALFEACCGSEVDYELNQTTRQLALALAALQATEALPALKAWTRDPLWKDSRFVSATRYAVWMLEQDADGALAHLQHGAHGLAYAASAIADLGATHHLPALRGLEVESIHARRAIDEAIRRLEGGVASGRMVDLLGVRHEYEIALGEERDDLFALGTPLPVEADESAPADR